jgi:cardiolipin synthase A/B
MLVPVVTVVFGAWIVGICGWILLERRSPAATIAWILALSLLPVIGIVVYLTLGPRRFDRKKLTLTRAREALASVRVRLEERADRELPPDARRISELVEHSTAAPPLPVDRYRLYPEGAPLYDALLTAFSRARHHIHLEYYIFNPDRIGTRVRDALISKAREGVEVRLLVDDIGSKRLGRKFLAPLIEAGARVATFNAGRISRLKPPYVNFRTHRKIAVIDGVIGFTGGMNIAEGHSAEFAGEDAWRDTHLEMEGMAVRALSAVFAENWYFADGTALADDVYFPARELTGEHLVQIVSSGPDRDDPAIRDLFFSAIAGAERKVLLTTPYFVPDEAVLTALTTTAARGIEVHILTPRKSDAMLVNAASKTWFDAILPYGVRIHLYEPRLIHAKTLIVDDGVSIVGTANMDNRSFRLNFEVVAVLYGPEPAAELTAQFENDLAFSTELTAEDRRDLPFPTRMIEALARAVSSQL